MTAGRAASAIALAGTSVVVGAAVPVAPGILALLLLVLLIVACIELVPRLRAASGSDAAGIVSSLQPEAAQRNSNSSLWSIARLLYLCGALTVAQLTFRPVGVLTVSDWFFLGALVLVVMATLLDRRRHPGLPLPLIAGPLLFALGSLLAATVSSLPLESLLLSARVLYVTVVWLWLGTLLLTDPRHVYVALVCWLVSASATGAAAVAQFFLGDVIPGTTIFFGRMTGFAQHVNDLGGSTAIALPVAVALAAGFSPSRLRLAAFGFMLLIAAGLILSGSVGGFIAAAVGVLVAAIVGTSARWVLPAVGLLVGVGVVASAIQTTSGADTPLDRIARVTGSVDDPEATFWLRLEGYEAAWEVIQANPLTGVGLDTIVRAPDGGTLVHNLIIEALYGVGIFGALGVGLVIASLSLFALESRWRARSERERTLAIALLASYAAFVVFSMGGAVLFQRYAWLPGMLVVALRVLQRPRDVSASQQDVKEPAPLRHADASL